MSSCFLCDTSYKFTEDDRYLINYEYGRIEKHYMKYMPIMIGSTGLGRDDQQHNDNNKQNYVSYRVKKIEFRSDVIETTYNDEKYNIPDYIIIFKVPFRHSVFDYHFIFFERFILFSEPESVLKYGVYPYRNTSVNWEVFPPVAASQKYSDKHDLIINKPFIVGPSDYVGVLYMFFREVNVDASAKVWFDVI